MPSYLPQDNLSYPVLIKLENSSGSGFYYNNDKKLFLVTAKHVLFNNRLKSEPLQSRSAQLISYGSDPFSKESIIVNVDLSLARVRKARSRDIALIEIGRNIADGSVKLAPGITNLTPAASVKMVVVPEAHLKDFKQVIVSNEIFILGYPSSLGLDDSPQISPNRPLLRKGIVAGLNTQNETIILDCPVYFGNSGGIAIEVEETGLGERTFHVIGVVSEYVPFVEKLTSAMGYVNRNVENSGYSIAVPIDTIRTLLKQNAMLKAKKRFSDEI